MEPFVSTLDASCDCYIGRAVFVAPFYGYGWGYGPGGPAREWNWVPAPFRVRVVRIYLHRGNRRGFVGRVDEPVHEFDGLWMVSMMRHRGCYDFNERPAAFNVGLCPQEPVQGEDADEPEKSQVWPVWHLQGSPTCGGFAVIAASEAECRNHEKQWIKRGNAK